MNPSKLEIPNEIAYLAPVLAYVGEVATAAGFSTEEARQVEIAVEEALSNVIRHGFQPGEQAVIQLQCEPAASGLTVAIRDKGIPFDPGTIPVYDPSDLAEGSTAGLGTFLMRNVVDEVTYRNLGREGKEILLRKHKASARVDALHPQPAPPAPPPASPRVPAHEFVIRPPRPEEAIEISRCAYQIYGYGYEDYIYYPERILEMHRECVLHSLVAATPAGRIAGHLALKRQNWRDAAAEVVVPFVEPEYRGSGLFRRLLSESLAGAGALGLRGVFARSPHAQDLSRNLFWSLGFRPCGLQSEAELVYRSTAAVPGRLLYPPERHRAAVSAIYDWLNLPAECAGAAPAALSGETLVDCYTSRSPDVAAIRLLHAGPDAVTAVRARYRQFALEGCQTVYLYLDLEDPSTATLADAFHELGFLFSGVLPGVLNGWDTLVLQKLETPANCATQPAYSEEGMRLRQWVQAL